MYSTKIPSQSFKIYLCLCFIISSFSNFVFSQDKTEFDVVISGGRVLDPETGLDQIKNIAQEKKIKPEDNVLDIRSISVFTANSTSFTES